MWLFAGAVPATEGDLGDYQSITSKYLGCDLQYRVYLPAVPPDGEQLSGLYVTDDQAYLEQGRFRQILDQMIDDGQFEPVLAVFLDSRNPDNLEENRRNKEFLCSTGFANFFATELVPQISRKRPVRSSRDDRVILDMSSGGLNSACFGVMVPDLFAGIAMQSPASGDHVDVVRKLCEQKNPLPLKMFLSVGTQNDHLSAVKRFKSVLEDKGYDLTYTKVPKGHDWKNWGPLLDDVLVTFFAKPE